MQNRFRIIALVVCISALAASAQPDARRHKKLIATGWDQPDAERLLKNYREMEQQPFDGVVVSFTGHDADGRAVPMRAAFSATPWDRQCFARSIEQVRACRFKRFTDNFLLVGANPGDVDWFDDAGWATIVDHWRIAARAAREAGFKGILFDPEPYSAPHAQFRYAAQPQHDQHTFAQYAAKARQRGREVIQAVAGEAPDLTLFCYFMDSICVGATGHADPGRILAAQGYGLLPAFIDGWLDAAPATMTFVDGCESAYLYNRVDQYLEAAQAIRGACQELVSTANRPRYRAQVQVSFGIYLDAYWNPPTTHWYIDGKGESRIERLRENVATAVRCADEYVWVYGEKFRWWPTPNRGVRAEYWAQALPGCDDALWYARDPSDYARVQLQRLRETGKLTNLAVNGAFDQQKVMVNGAADQWREGRSPAGWSTWQAEGSRGTFTWDRAPGGSVKDAARASGVSNGCFIQSYPVKPGERYAVRALRRLQGRGDAGIRIRWQDADGKWMLESQDLLAYATGPRDQWSEILAVAQVPPGVSKLVILLMVSDEPSGDDVAWFSDVGLYRLR